MQSLRVQGCADSQSWSGIDDVGRVLPMAVKECMSLIEISCGLAEEIRNSYKNANIF